MNDLDKYILDDSFKYLPQFPDNSVDLVFTSCPDISQTEYGAKKEIRKYKDEIQQKACLEFDRITKDDGFVVICQTDRKINGVILSNHHWYMDCMMGQGWFLKDYKIVVRNEVGKKDMYHFTFQHCLIFTKTGTIKRGGEWLRDIIVDPQKMTVKGQSTWSQEFCSLVINQLTKPGDLVVDPFAAAGPVPFAAKNLDRRYWACENTPERYNPDFSLFEATLPI